MNKKFSLLKSAKYIVLAAFLVIAIISVLLIGTVKINYNISDYLDESTDTKISLGIMEEEFGLISNIQVMVDGVTPEEAEEIKDQIKKVNNVIFVNFNAKNTDYYKDNSALFVVLVNGNEYSETAKTALADITDLLEDGFNGRVNFGGTVMEKKLLRQAIQSEIMLILCISVGLVAILMLLTAASWIEPLVLLAASGVAVLLNMGTNAIFGQISYITNAIAAILQLALSIDYSIVLLHRYRAIKEEESDNERAMLRAIKDVIKPVSASALTTIAGLLALLFMSFTIGFDIGSVLMKSIVISAITSLTLLPALLLLLDNLMQKTEKKYLVIKGKTFSDISLKAGKFIVPVAMVLIIVCCVLNLGNSYNFVDSCNKNENITDKFGESGTLIVLFENSENTDEKEEILAKLLASYKTEDGRDVLKSYVSHSNTIGQFFDVEKASNDLGLSMKDAELLFTIYYFTGNESVVKMDVDEFINFAMDLIENDPDAQGYVSEDTVKMLSLLLDLDALMSGEYTADELYEVISGLEMLGNMSLDQDSINQLYGLKFYDNVEQKKVNFGIMLNYLIDSGMIDEDLSNQLKRLPETYELISNLGFELTHPDTVVKLADVPGILAQYNIEIPDLMEGVDEVVYFWHNILGYGYSQKVSFETLFNDLISNPTVISYMPEDILKALESMGDVDYRYIYETKEAFDETFGSSYNHATFMPALVDLVEQATGEKPNVELDLYMEQQMQQLYIMYFIENGKIPFEKIGCIDFLNFILDTAKNNLVIAERLPEGADEKLASLIEDSGTLNNFLSNKQKRDYIEIKEYITSFAESIKTIDVEISISDTAMMGLYIKRAIATSAYDLKEISATDLLAFVLDASESNELLAARVTDEMRKTIKESQENIISAEKLLVADNYSRMLLTVNLPPESAESSRFVEYLSAKVHEIFGEDAYVAGEIATTNDLIKAFDDDNKLISVFTVVSIFIIIMVVFKSLSLPVLLVAVIQGAIWIAMSMSLIGGSMFFMSYIMSMCILMGATIDYGILLSTNYVSNRKSMDKKEALGKALDAAMPTIFTSGLILMICGFVVGFVASQTSISSVGFLLFRGTLISVVMITMVLPSLLYLLDKIVLMLTVKRSLVDIGKEVANSPVFNKVVDSIANFFKKISETKAYITVKNGVEKAFKVIIQFVKKVVDIIIIKIKKLKK